MMALPCIPSTTQSCRTKQVRFDKAQACSTEPLSYNYPGNPDNQGIQQTARLEANPPRRAEPLQPISQARRLEPLCPGNAVRQEEEAKHPRCPAHDYMRYTQPPQRFGPGENISNKIKSMRMEEDFRWENPHMCRRLFKYRGICGSLGNPVFTSTPVIPPIYTAKQPRSTFHAYPKPKAQHPMYKTSSAAIGSSQPYAECMPCRFVPRDQSFTLTQAIGGMYEDGYLTTELNEDPIW